MSEIGPCTINTAFTSLDQVAKYKAICPDGTYILGDNFLTDWKVVDGHLFVRSEQCVYDGWFDTGDKVQVVNTADMGPCLFYSGRN
jgi:hypothetical protein